MRVLYCTDTYPPQINGVSIVTALSVAGLSRRGWSCAVVAPRYPRDPGPVDGWVGSGPRGRDHEPAERLGTRVSRASAGRPRGRRHPRTHPALPARSSALRDGIHRRPDGPARGRRRGPAGRLDLSHRLRPLCRGLRRALASAGGDGLSEAVPSAEPPGLYALERGPAELATSAVGRGGVGPGGGYRPCSIRAAGARRSGPSWEWAADSRSSTWGASPPRSGWTSCSRHSARPRRNGPEGRHAPDPGRNRPVRGGAQGCGAARGHLSGLSRPPRPSCRISTPTATRSRSRR